MLKPKLKICDVEIFNQRLRFKVVNAGNFNATNIKLEVCSLNGDKTYHFEIDKPDFLVIPTKNKKITNDTSDERSFKTVNDSFRHKEDELRSGDTLLRIRLHACHSFTGFGRLSTFHYRYNNSQNKFIIEKM
jgi:hypothetical protein